ncbi:MAG TPA: hypothetical protein PK453_12910 [Leptospiraceae bacterium]|nr:hypothetical protein [Leptospiraceae bacterium]
MLENFIKKHKVKLKKAVRVSGILGTGIIFASSFVNDHFVTALQEKTQALDAIQNEKGQAQTAVKSGHDVLEATERLFKIEVTLNSISSKPRKEEFEGLFFTCNSYVDALKGSTEGLKESIADLKGIQKRVTLNDETKKEIEAFSEKIKSLSEKITHEMEPIEKMKADLEKEATAPGSFNFDQGDAALNGVMDKFFLLEDEYKKVGYEIYGLFDKIDEQVVKEQESSESTLHIVEVLAGFFAFLGAVLAGGGNWLAGRLGMAPGSVPSPEDEEASV